MIAAVIAASCAGRDHGGADDVPPQSELLVPAISTVTSSDPGDTVSGNALRPPKPITS
jgi:hypothetical protein